MKYLKKVSASQLISSEGTIIDSMNPGDDQTVNAPSIHAVKDYVSANMESGSNSNGYYIKFGDGTMICWGMKSIGSATWTMWGSTYSTTFTNPITFPQTFVTTVSFSIINAGNAAASYTRVDVSGTGVTRLDAMRGTSGSTAEYIVQWTAVGRWKQ